MQPQRSQVFSQKYWPAVGDIDDCWALADLMSVCGVAPWLWLPDMTAYRAAAGNPDQPGVTGGTIAQSVKAITTLYPLLAPLLQVSENTMTIAQVLAAGKQFRPLDLSVLSAELPVNFGFLGRHRVTVFWTDSGWKIANPLAAPHSKPIGIPELSLIAAIKAYPEGVRCIVMPTVDEAFKTHPLYGSAVTLGKQLEWDLWHSATGSIQRPS